MSENKVKKIPRYIINGHIERECLICGLKKNLICFTDKLTGDPGVGCKSCLEETLGIKIGGD